MFSFILCSRNDRYQGDSIWRLETALNYLARNVQAIQREHDVEVILTDWGSEVPLRDTLRLTPAAQRLVSFLYVSKTVAAAVQQDSPFPEVLALNAAARRARGQYIGRIDQDTLLGRRFLTSLFAMQEGKRELAVPFRSALMLANRRCIPYRFAVHSPSAWMVDRFVRWFWRWLPLMAPLPPELFYQSYVGIWLLHRDLWYAIGGYDERFIYMDWQEVDMYLRLSPPHTLVNLGELVDHDLYHLDHAHPLSEWGASGRNRNSNPRRDFDHLPAVRHPNDADWGLQRYDLQLQRSARSEADAQHVEAERWQRAAWIPFMARVTVTGIRMLGDVVLLMLLLTIRAILKSLLSCSPELKRRIEAVRDALREQPLRAWPRLTRQAWMRGRQP